MDNKQDSPFFCVCANDDHSHGTADCTNPAAINKDGRYLHDRLCESCYNADLTSTDEAA